jgi:hypothetical protein
MRSRLGAWITGVLVALVALGLWAALRARHPLAAIEASSDVATIADQQEAARVQSPSTPNVPPSSTATLNVAATAKPTPATQFAPPDEAAMIEVDKVSLMIRDYRTLAKENPVGTNAEIMAAVMGGNPKEAELGPPEGMTLNENGELIDRWGTPYFFHQLSRDQMEIRSAGADKVMWTEDDAVAK